MPGESKAEQYIFGGVDSRSNPANFPSGRALRVKNFRPLSSGQLRLRYGYTVPLMNAVAPEQGAIHSAAYYEQFSGSQSLLFGATVALNSLDMASGTITELKVFTSGNPWGHFRAANRIFIGNGVDRQVNYDGTKLRNSGLRAPTQGEAAIVGVAVSATAGTWATTQLSGYQLYMVYYNPITGQVGNRVKIGNRILVGTPLQSVDLNLLPDLSMEDTELVKGFGRTNDGGEVPYWLIDAAGNRVVAGNTQATANITDSTVDTTQELPTRNGLPPDRLNKFARVGSRIFAARDADHFLYYTEDESDISNGNFVGVPHESWAGDNAEAFPTGQVPTALHAYRLEGWFYSKTHLAIWSQYLFQQGTNPWRGPWPVGCAGQRAWIETPKGPFWMTPGREIMGFNQGGPVNVSDEYEKALLGKIATQYISQTELAYLRDPEKKIDCLYILGKDKDGGPVFVIHDFLLKDDRSTSGQGYEALYAGMTPTTLAGSGFTPRQNVFDLDGRERLWCGTSDQGRMLQLEDGADDNGNVYSGDIIGLVNVGPEKRTVNALQWQGDSKIVIKYSTKPTLGLDEMTDTKPETLTPDDNVFEAVIAEEARWIFVRIQLDSHVAGDEPTDPVNNFDATDPPSMPFASYGLVNFAMAKLGTSRVGR